MSQVNVVSTELADKDIIIQTLEEMGMKVSVSETGDIALKRAYGGQDTKCDIVVSREEFNKIAKGNAYDGLGFKKKGNKYSVVIDSMDRQYFDIKSFTQSYAKSKIVRELNKSGMWGVESVRKNKADEIKIRAVRLV